jgi:hypothetical protein
VFWLLLALCRSSERNHEIHLCDLHVGQRLLGVGLTLSGVLSVNTLVTTVTLCLRPFSLE